MVSDPSTPMTSYSSDIGSFISFLEIASMVWNPKVSVGVNGILSHYSASLIDLKSFKIQQYFQS
jgi:hypothetical protein